jgi:PII-like signaling protein
VLKNVSIFGRCWGRESIFVTLNVVQKNEKIKATIDKIANLLIWKLGTMNIFAVITFSSKFV